MSEDWRTTLREKGYRLTPQRELILGAVNQLGPATPDEVLAEVRKESQTVNASTVYRKCHDVISVDPPMLDDLRAELTTAHGFTVDVGHLTVFGTCGGCS